MNAFRAKHILLYTLIYTVHILLHLTPYFEAPEFQCQPK